MLGRSFFIWAFVEKVFFELRATDFTALAPGLLESLHQAFKVVGAPN